MSNENIETQLKGNFSDCITDMTTASDNMVISEKQVYKCEKIESQLYGEKNVPKSADAIFFKKGCLIIVEFKGGLRDKYSSYTDDLKRARECEKRELRTSIYAKGLDTYLVMEHDFGLGIAEKNQKSNFIAVINDKEVGEMDETMAILNEAAAAHERDLADNEVYKLTQALRKLNKRGKSASPYLYDNVYVMTATEFKNKYC